MTQLLCGNIVALLASILMVYSGSVKDTKKIIYIQTIQISPYSKYANSWRIHWSHCKCNKYFKKCFML